MFDISGESDISISSYWWFKFLVVIRERKCIFVVYWRGIFFMLIIFSMICIFGFCVLCLLVYGVFDVVD